MNRFVALCFLTGCVGLIQQIQGDQAGTPDPDGSHHVIVEGEAYRVGPYWGPDCERLQVPKNRVDHAGFAEATMGKQPNLSHDVKDQIFRMVCAERVLSGTSEPERNTWVVQHFRFDEVSFDQLTAAEMIVQCLEAESCLDEGVAAQTTNERRAAQAYQVGMMRWYADRVDPAEVGKRIAVLGLPPEAAHAFVALVDRAKTRVIAVSDAMSPDAKRLFVDLPAQIHQRREAELGKHQAIVDKLIALTDRVKGERASGVTDETIEQLRALRASYHTSCKADCTRGTLFAAITQQLFWAYVSRGDSPGAAAEAKLLEHLDPSAAQDIATKQAEAFTAARGRAERVSRAREQGIDADTARSTANGALVDLGDVVIYRWDSSFAINYEALVPDKVGQAGGKVAAIDKKGTIAVIRFADDVSSWTEETNCYETNRVDGIDSNGKLIYREQCAGETTRTEHHKVDPITVPVVEATGLRAGDEVVAFVNDNRGGGRIWMVKHGDRVVRLRDMTL